jgi:hypothetical protein
MGIAKAAVGGGMRVAVRSGVVGGKAVAFGLLGPRGGSSGLVTGGDVA